MERSFLGRDRVRGDLLGGDLLVDLAGLERAEGLEEAGAVVRARGVRELEHLLRELAVELGGSVGEVRLDVDELLEVVELAVHLEDRHLLVEVHIRAVRKLDARERAGELLAARDPRDGRALVEEVDRVEVVDALALDHLDLKRLADVVGDEVSREDRDDEVRVCALRADELVEVRLARLDRGLDRLKRVAALLHVALDLPGELDLIRDVEVDREVHEIAHARVVERVEALDDHDVGRLDLLRGVEGAVHVVVDRLLDRLARLERGKLLVHEVEVVLGAVESGALGHLAALAVVEVVVIEADHGHVVRHEGVGLPAVAVAEAAAERADVRAAEVLHEAVRWTVNAVTTGASSASARTSGENRAMVLQWS